MGVVIAYGSGNDPEKLRQIVLGSGLDCAEDDTVPLEQLEERLPQTLADLILVVHGPETEQALAVIRHAVEAVPAPVVAMGPTSDSQLVLKSLRAGAKEYLDIADPRNELDAALDKLSLSDEDPRIRGTIIAVYSPTPGSGTTTVAGNLAGALAAEHPGDVSLLEITRDDGDLALFLDIEPAYTVQDACERWDRLDTTSLGAGLIEHDAGLAILAHKVEAINNEVLTPAAIRRISVLLRSMFSYSVLDLDNQLSPEQIEAMRMADVILLLIRPDIPSVRRAQRVLRTLEESAVDLDRIRMVINRWGQSGQLPLSSIAETLELEPFQLIPDDSRRVNTAINQGMLLQQMARGAAITRKFSQLASQLNGRS